jgi:hypothetical protein
MIHYFNPGHEAAILNRSPYYHAPSNVVQMQRDLAFLPAWYAEEGDFVLTENDLPENFRQRLSLLTGFSTKSIPQTNLSLQNQIPRHQKVALWGISPQSIHHFELLNEKHKLDLSIPTWHDLFAEFSHRQKASEYLNRLSQFFPFVSTKLAPRFCSSMQEVETILQEEREIHFLAKAPLSSSGRGLVWLPKGELTRTERQILHGTLKKQRSVSIEYALRKETDFAMEFFCDGAGRCDFRGYSLFETNAKGNYAGNLILPQQEIERVLSKRIPQKWLELIKGQLREWIETDLAPIYEGYIGVDMMIYSEEGQSRLHPCVEINLRSNMGILSVQLQRKYVFEKSRGHFAIDFFAKKGEIMHHQAVLEEKHPPVIEDGKMCSGFFMLCPATEENHYMAYLLLNGLS